MNTEYVAHRHISAKAWIVAGHGKHERISILRRINVIRTSGNVYAIFSPQVSRCCAAIYGYCNELYGIAGACAVGVDRCNAH